MQQSDSSAELCTAGRLRPLSKPPRTHQVREQGNVLREKNRVVEEFLMTVVAEHADLPLNTPGALLEQAGKPSAATVGRPAKEPLRHVMVPRRMPATLDARTRVLAVRTVKPAATDRARFDRCPLHLAAPRLLATHPRQDRTLRPTPPVPGVLRCSRLEDSSG